MKGFTLIELLAVIVILAIILLISVPIIGSLIENTKKSAFESSAKGYMESAKNLYVSNSLNGITEDTVINYSNGISNNSNFQINGKEPESGTIVIYKNGTIEFALYNGEYCAIKNISGSAISVSKTIVEDCIIELPQLTLIGDAIVNLEMGSPYTDLGVNYETGVLETTIRKDGAIVSSIETSSIGTYEITYRLTVSEKFNTITRTVKINDTIPPVLTVPGNISIEVSEVASFNALAGVTVTDNSGEVITPSVEGSIAEIAGVYTLTYTATDSSGNTTTKTREITVNSSDLVDTSKLNVTQMQTAFSGNTNTARGTNSFVDGGIIQSSSNSWDGAFIALNQSIPRSGILTVEYEVAFNVAHYAGASVGASLQIANAQLYDPNSTTGYYNAPQVAGIFFQSFGAYTTFRWNVVAGTSAQNIPAAETFTTGINPAMAINTYYKIKAVLNLTTGDFEYYYNNTLIKTGKFSATSMNTLGANVKVIFVNGNYTAQVASYKNIKVKVD